MAYSSASLSANEIAWVEDGKPFFSGNSAIVYNSMKWVVGTNTGTGGSANGDATGFEAYRAVDGLPGRVTKPNAANTAFTFVFDWSADPISFDWFGMLNHNLYTLNATLFRVEIANDTNFLFNKVTIVARSSLDDRRFADRTLGANQRYTDVPWARVRITCTSGVPEVGQFIFGRRRQQHRAPEVPWDPTNETSTMYQFDSPGGVRRRKAKRKGRREINAAFTHDAGWPAVAGYSTFEADIDGFWTDIRGGKEPFYWMEPSAGGNDDFWMFRLAPPELQYPHINATTRQFVLRGVEQGPQAQYYSQGP